MHPKSAYSASQLLRSSGNPKNRERLPRGNHELPQKGILMLANPSKTMNFAFENLQKIRIFYKKPLESLKDAILSDIEAKRSIQDD